MKFTTGMVTGMILGAAGIAGYAMSDRRTRKKVVRGGRRVIEKANGVIDNITDML